MQCREFPYVFHTQFFAVFIAMHCHMLSPVVLEKPSYILKKRNPDYVSQKNHYSQNSVYKVKKKRAAFLLKSHYNCKKVRQSYKKQYCQQKRECNCRYNLSFRDFFSFFRCNVCR